MEKRAAVTKKELDETLTAFGLGDTERKTYLALLPMGTTTLTPLATRAGLKPTTVQSALARLVNHGLVEIGKRKSRSSFAALDPVVMRRILERRAEETARIIPALQSLRTASPTDTKIKVYYRERATDIFHQALAARSKTVREIVAARDIQDILGEKFHFTRRRVAKGVKLRSLRVEAREIKKYSAAAHLRELREARFLPRELTFRTSMMCWDDTVAFFTTKAEGLAWTVQSATLAETMRQLFELLWSVGRRMETATEAK